MPDRLKKYVDDFENRRTGKRPASEKSDDKPEEEETKFGL